MKRQQFLAGLFPLITAPFSGFSATEFTNKEQHLGRLKIGTVPPYLQAGDKIGIVSPSGPVNIADVQKAKQYLESWGFQVVLGKYVGNKHFNFGGTDEERTADLQAMLDDASIKCIFCARGGYGVVRIIDALDFTLFKKHPKWITGFSDISVLHAHVQAVCKTASIHSKMCSSFPDSWDEADEERKATILSIKEALTGTAMQYFAPPHSSNKIGTAKGILLGGNLRTLESLAGSKSALPLKNALLFIEDVGEYRYNIDRILRAWYRNGILAELKGLIVGGFDMKEDLPDEAFGSEITDIVTSVTKNYDYPVCFNFPVGHQKNNYALKCGMPHQLIVSNNGSILKETNATAWQTVQKPSINL